mmetsp:Transcript_51958/g.147240  ORF Transcript_51958/g.147240 Transcript_51958/m.147240 type:complete len:205 (+) Transcript_51958:70-684(+)
MGLLEVVPLLDVPLHLQPHREEAERGREEVAQLAEEDPAVGDEHQVAELPEAVEPVGDPTLRHHRTAVVVAARAVVDAAHGGDAARTVLLARVTDGLNDLLLQRKGCHTLADVLDGIREGLRRLRLKLLEAGGTNRRHLAVAERLLRASGLLGGAREDSVAEFHPRPVQRQPRSSAAHGHGQAAGAHGRRVRVGRVRGAEAAWA